MSYTLDPVFGCHLAQGRTDRDGYVFHGKKRAHTVAWEAVNGVVPEGMELDHTCRRRSCCRVAHLELVTRSENEKRKHFRHRMRITRCKSGHDLSLNRVMTPTGGFVCRSCNREAL